MKDVLSKENIQNYVTKTIYLLQIHKTSKFISNTNTLDHHLKGCFHAIYNWYKKNNKC